MMGVNGKLVDARIQRLHLRFAFWLIYQKLKARPFCFVCREKKRSKEPTKWTCLIKRAKTPPGHNHPLCVFLLARLPVFRHCPTTRWENLNLRPIFNSSFPLPSIRFLSCLLFIALASGLQCIFPSCVVLVLPRMP